MAVASQKHKFCPHHRYHQYYQYRYNHQHHRRHHHHDLGLFDYDCRFNPPIANIQPKQQPSWFVSFHENHLVSNTDTNTNTNSHTNTDTDTNTNTDTNINTDIKDFAKKSTKNAQVRHLN